MKNMSRFLAMVIEKKALVLYTFFLYFDFLLFLYLYVSTSRREITFDVRASGINF